MPHISARTPSGPASFHYTISTPTQASASSIDPALPTIVFLHPVYISQHIFHPQFSDPKLRRFNLVAFDARLHGKTIGEVPSDFRRAEAAEDVFYAMQALSLPPCHVVGLSMGACVALQLAVTHPDIVLSLTMISPLPLEEPADVAEGRNEIYECWADSQSSDVNAELDQDALHDAISGALQLGFNGQQTKLIQTMVQLTVPDALRSWTYRALDQLHTVSVKFFCDRKPHSMALLKRVQCPLTLVHCGADIAYPLEFAEELHRRLEEAGLDARLVSVNDAPHFGSVTHFTEINNIIHNSIMKHNAGSKVPPAPGDVVSPFEVAFKKHGCARMGLTDSDDSSDEDFFVN